MIPNTLTGILCLCLSIVFFTGVITTTSQPESIVDSTITNLQTGVTNFSQSQSFVDSILAGADIFSNILYIPIEILAELVKIIAVLPIYFIILFGILTISLVIAIVKLIRGVWDR
jgi:hypothetical protein